MSNEFTYADVLAADLRARPDLLAGLAERFPSLSLDEIIDMATEVGAWCGEAAYGPGGFIGHIETIVERHRAERP